SPLGTIEAPHQPAAAVRAALQAQVLAIAVQNAGAVFKGRPSLLPGMAERAPVAAAPTLQAYESEWVEKLEAALYAPFEDAPPMLEYNKYCLLCHIEQRSRSTG